MNEILNIITITKNDLEGLLSTIESTKKLRIKHNIHQIIVDSSTVEAQTKIKEFIINEHNISYVWQEPSGISSAFNLGLSLSKSEWIWFLNGGDQVHPEIDTAHFLYIIEQSKADAIIFDFELMPSGIKPSHPPLWLLWPPLSAWIPHLSTLTRRGLYDMYGKFNESYQIAMDFEFWLRCFSKHVLVDMLSIPIAKFDTNGRSYTNSTQTSQEAVSIIKKHLRNIFKIWFMNGVFIIKTSWNYLKHSKRSHY